METCKHGHPWDGANTYVRPNGSRLCRACRRASVKKCRPSQKEIRRRNQAKIKAALRKGPQHESS